MFSRHHEQLSHHSGTFTNVLLYKFRTRYPDESTVGVMCNRSSEKGLTRPRWTVEQDALGLSDTQTLKEFGVLNGQLDNFLNLLDLLVQTTNHLICTIRNLFDHHERDEGVDLVGEDGMEEVRIGSKGNSDVRGKGRDGDIGGEVNHCDILSTGFLLEKK